jgi:tRNA-dihydrouridine synthase
MRRHYSNYFKGYPGIKPFRHQLVTEMDPATLLATLDEIEEVFSRQELEMAS